MSMRAKFVLNKVTKQSEVCEELQFNGVGSAFNELEGQFGYAIIERFDTKVDLDLRGGYSFQNRTGVFEPLLTLKKKPTPNTYAEIGISLPIYFNPTDSFGNHLSKFSPNPTFMVETGFTF